MIPIPFVNYIPQFFNRDAKLLALSNKTDAHLNEWRNEVLSLNTIIDPARMPSLLLEDMGQLLNAGIVNSDSDRVKRQKIWNAIQSHRNRGTWRQDVKARIDAFVGGDASLFGQDLTIDDDSIVVGGLTSEPDNYWSVFGSDGVDPNGGIFVVGAGDEVVLAGVVNIDVDSSTLTADEVDDIKEDLVDSIPEYYRVFLGYVSGGVFIPYANGEI